jgi:integrase
MHFVNRGKKVGLGGIKLKKLSAAHVQGFYRDRLDHGLSPSIVHKLHAILHKALSQALTWHMVPRNVTETVRPPRPAPRKMCPLTSEEARRLLQAARGNGLEALYVLAVTTGMRQGELLALRWQDVDMKNGTVSIRRTLTRNGGNIEMGNPRPRRAAGPSA